MCVCFFFNDTATTEIYPLSLHDALPISGIAYILLPAIWANSLGLVAMSILQGQGKPRFVAFAHLLETLPYAGDRKSTRLNSSHANISYAVFCLKKKNII